jgi:hypothetical protein
MAGFDGPRGPKPLFEAYLEGSRSEYQVTSNRQKVLVNLPPESTTAAPITVVTNWTAGLTK